MSNSAKSRDQMGLRGVRTKRRGCVVRSPSDRARSCPLPEFGRSRRVEPSAQASCTFAHAHFAAVCCVVLSSVPIAIGAVGLRDNPSAPPLLSSAPVAGTVESVERTSESSGPRPPAVTMTLIDGTKRQGTWAGCRDGNTVQVQTDDGMETFTLDGLESITHDDPDQHGQEVAGPAVFYLSDGGILHGRLAPGSAAAAGATGNMAEQDVIHATTALGAHLPFPFDRLAAVRLGHPDEASDSHALFEEARSARLAAKDVLITKGTEGLQATAVRGLLASLNADAGEFAFGGRVRTFQTEKVYGVVFAAGAHAHNAKPSVDGVTVLLRDGARFAGSLRPLGACGFEVNGTRPDHTICVASSIGPTVAVSWSDVASLQIHSNRVVYVSGLAPSKKAIEGIVHRTVLGRTIWPVGMDVSVAGGPLVLGGHRFERGLGVHSRTELVYQVDGAFESFVASIGIDDAVRPQGNVIFRVLGDERILFDSGIVTGQDAPQDIAVDIKGVEALTLLVDYGEDLDIADAAVWGGARLLKPAS